MNNRFETPQEADNQLTISIAQAFNDIRAKNQRLTEINKELVEALADLCSVTDIKDSNESEYLRAEAALAKARRAE